jgi:hypothetical protein
MASGGRFVLQEEEEQHALPTAAVPFEVEQQPTHAEVIRAKTEVKQQRRYTEDAFIGEDQVNNSS